ncbi:TMEM165/GDT1 family protein [Sphingomonas sp. TREG-RG-20F-R18-01]|uniref:TMEM165/GDT1 family protein n=1 Tax=Sphingomonas sp. TREG-RG-20F-R18-01 TaxID=2914982 RepID=UPI001F572DF5|nr:TMEM165/GDT1 family protein [Sphingomonas sp. TREG-RG-20F-R18-01]
MAALVAALLVQASDRTPFTSALLGTRFADKRAVLAGIALAIALGNAAGAIGGWLAAPYVSPDAADLLVAFAVLSAGVAACWPIRSRGVPQRLGAFPAALTAIGLLAIGDRTQCITAALAARSSTPALAAVGATIGAIAVNVPAVFLGERGWGRLPLTPVRRVAAAVLIIVGAIQTLAAMRLI